MNKLKESIRLETRKMENEKTNKVIDEIETSKLNSHRMFKAIKHVILKKEDNKHKNYRF